MPSGSRGSDQTIDGTVDHPSEERRAEPPPRLRERPGPCGKSEQPSQWHERQDPQDRRWAGDDRRAAGSLRQFRTKIVGKYERHFDGFDDKILSMYARGMSVRDIRAHLEEIYGVEVSPELISRVTDAVVD